jgi:hypothetical protein
VNSVTKAINISFLHDFLPQLGPRRERGIGFWNVFNIMAVRESAKLCAWISVGLSRERSRSVSRACSVARVLRFATVAWKEQEQRPPLFSGRSSLERPSRANLDRSCAGAATSLRESLAIGILLSPTEDRTLVWHARLLIDCSLSKKEELVRSPIFSHSVSTEYRARRLSVRCVMNCLENEKKLATVRG